MPRTIEPTKVETTAVAASHGDMDALAELYEHYSDHVLRFICLHTRSNVTAAEDLAAASWERVARSIRSYQSRREGFTAWLFTIVRNCLTDHYRLSGRRKEVLSGDMLLLDTADTATPDAALDGKVRREEVAAAVSSLSKPQRQCVTLRFFVGLSLAETAAVMGKNVNAVKQVQHRALLTLRRRLGPVTHGRVAAGTYLAVDPVSGMTMYDISGGKAR